MYILEMYSPFFFSFFSFFFIFFCLQTATSASHHHRAETLLALQEQHESITSSFLGENDVGVDEIERINSILADRMSTFYDMCERDNEQKLNEDGDRRRA